MVDAAEGVLGLEWIDGESVKAILLGEASGEDDEIKHAEIAQVPTGKWRICCVSYFPYIC